jgi:hypothetical protein
MRRLMASSTVSSSFGLLIEEVLEAPDRTDWLGERLDERALEAAPEIMES